MAHQLIIEIPDELAQSFASYLDCHPERNCDQVITASLALFLMQNSADAIASRVYLSTLFGDVL